MNCEDIQRIQKIFFNLGSFNRNLYRSVVREKPKLNLPSERQIDKEFGSFGVFANKIKQKEETVEIKNTATRLLSSGIDVDLFKNFTSTIKPKKEAKDLEDKIKPKDSGIFKQNDNCVLDEDIGQTEISMLKEMIRKKRLELFKSKLKEYRWNPESRTNLFW